MISEGKELSLAILILWEGGCKDSKSIVTSFQSKLRSLELKKNFTLPIVSFDILRIVEECLGATVVSLGMEEKDGRKTRGRGGGEREAREGRREEGGEANGTLVRSLRAKP